MRWFDVKWFSGRRAILLPLFGAGIGAIGAAIESRFTGVFPDPVATFAIAALWTALALLPREQQRFGSARATAIAAAMAVRWLAIHHLATSQALAAFVAAQTVPRSAMIALAWGSRPAHSGAGYAFSSTLTTWIALAAIAAGSAAAFVCGFRPGATMIAGAYLILRAVRWFAYRQSGGVNADALGAMQLLTELFVLLMFDCAACRW